MERGEGRRQATNPAHPGHAPLFTTAAHASASVHLTVGSELGGVIVFCFSKHCRLIDGSPSLRLLRLLPVTRFLFCHRPTHEAAPPNPPIRHPTAHTATVHLCVATSMRRCVFFFSLVHCLCALSDLAAPTSSCAAVAVKVSPLNVSDFPRSLCPLVSTNLLHNK